MDAAFEQKYHALEETHWWFRARRDCILKLLESQKVSVDASILDIGCGGGALLSQLRDRGFLDNTGIDISDAAVARCRARGLANVHPMDAQSPHFPANGFDCLIASDILEHLSNPAVALRGWRQLLRPGGILLVFVPAFAFLWSAHDRANHHYRRYTRPALCQQIHDAGLTILRSGYWNTTLFPAISVARLAQRLHGRRTSEAAPHDALHRAHPLMNQGLFALLRAENSFLAAGFSAPLGVSTWALAQRPKE